MARNAAGLGGRSKPESAGAEDYRRTELDLGAPWKRPHGGEEESTDVEPTVRREPHEVMASPESPVALSSAPAELASGLRVHQYELIRELGRGGMGRVFLARDTKLGRRVAIKFLTEGARSVGQRFLIEARATARCSHENIVVIHEVNEYRGTPFMVLEYLEGQTLAKAMAGRQLPPARAVDLIVPVVRALVRAHEFNIIHRDLKPDNIFLTDSGSVKVLDFGIAKAFTDSDDRPSAPDLLAAAAPAEIGLTREGALMGTLPYMSPEQSGMDEVDHRTDIWAIGIILFEMVTGQHPLAPISPRRLLRNAAMLDEPMPGVSQFVADLPARLEQIIDGCLRKRKAQRIASARDLLNALEPLLPGRYGRQLAEGESPYPGLAPFQEADADRFFGRARDVVKLVARIRDQALIGVVGPSGVGKSSFVRAGLVPALKASGESWEVFTLRPGRDPLAGLASLLQPITTSSSSDLATKMAEHDALVARLRAEPGYLGTLLRSRARQKEGRILLFIDQLEELYTLVHDEGERAAFTACLAGAADDAATPLRVVVSMRSDFLDRAAESQRFMDDLMRGLVFLAPPDRKGLREALTQPIEMVGYRFESESMLEHMLDALETTPGALPLLQFAAAKLWDSRDRQSKLLSQASYEAMGGVTGALAAHADQVLSELSPEGQRLARSVFQHLVTPERTRAVVDVTELLRLSANPTDVQRLVDQLVQARLLVVQTRGEAEGPAVEIVHESLIEGWPRLRRWLDESQEDAAFVAQLRAAAKQWHDKGRPNGLLWRGEAMEEARWWYERSPRELPVRESQFLFAVFALANRSARIRRSVVIGVIVFLAVLVAAAAVALLWIRDAEKEAKHQAEIARQEAQAAKEAKDSEVAATLREQKANEEAKKTTRVLAVTQGKVAETREELQAANQQLQEALADAEAAQERAEVAQKRAEAQSRNAAEQSRRANVAAEKAKLLNEQLQKLLADKKKEIERLKKQQKGRVDDL